MKFVPYVLPIYFVVYFGIAFVLKSVITARRIGKNPVVFPQDESAYALIGFYFKITLMAMFLYVVLYACLPTWHVYFLPIHILENTVVVMIGFCVLAFALLWTITAQIHMKDSWRIGIDELTPTTLVTNGLFGVSRNPIFLGMLLSLLGLFLITPNGCTLLFLILGFVLIQIQIRLEEEFLLKQHGVQYQVYMQRVRRLL
jgi:protein-S-isoprenylcysteine O-methyltransferase Ste14